MLFRPTQTFYERINSSHPTRPSTSPTPYSRRPMADLDLIEILHDIAQGIDERATTNDRITAANILADRGLGKSPRQISPNPGPTPEPAPETDNNDVGAIRESPPAVPHDQPESPRLVTQIKDALNDTLGPAPHPKHALSTIHQPLSTTNYHPTAHPRNHQQRPDHPRHPGRDSQGQRRPQGQTLPPSQGRPNPTRPTPRYVRPNRSRPCPCPRRPRSETQGPLC